MGNQSSNLNEIDDPDWKVYESGLANQQWTKTGKCDWTDIDVIDFKDFYIAVDIQNKVVKQITKNFYYKRIELKTDPIILVDGKYLRCPSHTYQILDCEKIIIARHWSNAREYGFSRRVSVKHSIFEYDIKTSIDQWNWINKMGNKMINISFEWNRQLLWIDKIVAHQIKFDEHGNLYTDEGIRKTYYRIFNFGSFIAADDHNIYYSLCQ